MKKTRTAIILACAAAVASGCATIKPPEKPFYVPVLTAETGTGSVSAVAFDPVARGFTGIAGSPTVAFYTGERDTVPKKVGAGTALRVASARKEAVGPRPAAEDILVIKTAFTPGWDATIFFSMLIVTVWTERSQPDRYLKDLVFDIDKVRGDFIETEYMLAAVNRGNRVVKDLYLVDVLALPVQFVSSRFTTANLFIPLNVNLAALDGVEQKLVTQGNRKVLVFHVLPKKDGIKPGDMVQIVVKVRIRKDDLMKPEYLAKN
jgi:hypothetical protein